MAKSMESAMAKYQRKTAPGGPGEQKYQAKKGQMVQNWQRGLAEAGMPPGPISTQAYQQGVAGAQYRGGNPQKWLENTRAGISR